MSKEHPSMWYRALWLGLKDFGRFVKFSFCLGDRCEANQKNSSGTKCLATASLLPWWRFCPLPYSNTSYQRLVSPGSRWGRARLWAWRWRYWSPQGGRRWWRCCTLHGGLWMNTKAKKVGFSNKEVKEKRKEENFLLESMGFVMRLSVVPSHSLEHDYGENGTIQPCSHVLRCSLSWPKGLNAFLGSEKECSAEVLPITESTFQAPKMWPPMATKKIQWCQTSMKTYWRPAWSLSSNDRSYKGTLKWVQSLQPNSQATKARELNAGVLSLRTYTLVVVDQDTLEFSPFLVSVEKIADLHRFAFGTSKNRRTKRRFAASRPGCRRRSLRLRWRRLRRPARGVCGRWGCLVGNGEMWCSRSRVCEFLVLEFWSSRVLLIDLEFFDLPNNLRGFTNMRAVSSATGQDIWAEKVDLEVEELNFTCEAQRVGGLNTWSTWSWAVDRKRMVFSLIRSFAPKSTGRFIHPFTESWPFWCPFLNHSHKTETVLQTETVLHLLWFFDPKEGIFSVTRYSWYSSRIHA